MKSSKYNFYFKNGDKKYVYNILSTAIIEVDNIINDALINNKINSNIDEYIEYLTSAGFVVPNDMNETYMFKEYYESTRYANAASDLRVMLIPTYSCNLRCPYCYEGQHKNPGIITRDNLKKIILFIKNTISESNIPIKKLIISLFGGEPTLCFNALKTFCDELNQIAIENKLELLFDITTNFTLVDDRLLELIDKYKISVQVTIDGPKDMHDTRRITTDGQGTYDTIIANLKKARDYGLKDYITIRINTDQDNLDECEDVFKEMLNYSDDVYFGILEKYEGRNNEYENNCMDIKMANDAFSKKLLKFYKDNGLDIPIKFGKRGPCSINTVNRYMIDLKMNVYKCDLLLNIENYKVGIIDEKGNFIKNANYYRQMGYSPFEIEKCVNCKYLPLCSSNCPAERILKETINDGSLPCGYCLTNEQMLADCLGSYVSMVEK